MEQRGQFTFYRSYYEALKDLPKKDRSAVYEAICAYALDGIEPDLSGIQKSVFTLVRPTLDSGRKKAIGGKNGKPNSKDNTKIPERFSKDTEKEKEREKEKEIEGEIEKEYECTPPTPSSGGRKQKRFSKPSVDDVRLYCQESGYTVDPDRFCDYYESNGWKVGKNPMKDWKAAVRTWAKNQNNSRHAQKSRHGDGDELLDMIKSGVFDE